MRAGAYFNADTRDARKVCFNHGLIPNVDENKRNQTWAGIASTAGGFSSVEPVSDVSFPDAIPSTAELLEHIEALEARIAALEAGE